MLAARALISAVSLGVFDALAASPAEPAAVADRLGLDAEGVETLLAALRSLGYVEPDQREGKSVRPTAAAVRLLTRTSTESIASFVGDLNAYHWEVLGRLDDVLQTGRPRDWHQRSDDDLWQAYVQGLFQVSRGEHDANAALVPVDHPRRLLDIGGAHGAFAMAMCRRHPELRATVLDLPASVAVGRTIVATEGFEDRVDFQEGDALEVDAGSDFDVVSAFNVLHHFPPDRCLELLCRVWAALRPGGCLVVGETERPKPEAPIHQMGALSGLLFYAMSGARTYSRDELSRLAEAAGFGTVRFHRNERSPWRVVMVAIRSETALGDARRGLPSQ